MIRPVLLVPDPRLKQVCASVEHFDESLQTLARDLEHTLGANPGCVGIAACQVGEMVRVALVDTSQHKKHGVHSQGRFVLVNPRLIHREGELFGREGCLSLPDYTANVRRAESVTVTYWDLAGEQLQLSSTGYEAVVLQHEIDHLDGILFLDRVANLSTDLFPRKRK